MSMATRSVLCTFLTVPLGDEPPRLPKAEREKLQPWTDRWTKADGSRVWVRAIFHDGRMTELVDAREWIETLADERRWPAGTVFELVAEREPAA